MRGSIGSPTLCSLINLPVMVEQLGAAGPGQQVAQVSDTQLRLGFVTSGLGLTLAGIKYRRLQPPLRIELAIAGLKGAQGDVALERFVKAARRAYQEHDMKLAARDEATAGG
jgi:hypothetical protein